MKTDRAPLVSFVMILCLASLAPAAHAYERSINQTWTYPAKAGKKVIIDAGDVDVHVRAGDVNRVHVTAQLKISGVTVTRALSWIKYHMPTMTDQDDALTITIPRHKEGFLGLGYLTGKAHLGVILPISMIPDITTRGGTIELWGDFPGADPLRLRTATGAIHAVGAAVSVDARSVSGDIRIDVVRPLESFFARTAGGDVTLTGGAKKVHVDTASGDIWLNALSGPASIVTSSGKVTLRWDRIDPSDTIKVRGTSGDVRLVLPKGVKPSGHLRTVKGKISTDLAATISPDGMSVTFEGAGPLLDVETASGKIELGERGGGWEISPPAFRAGRTR
ncbi:MAG: DUF4097 domain-containing protein [Acidobacteria bacterium]|nr:DUF4097 domain-containing protein [Acidobacteriota bacterium]